MVVVIFIGQCDPQQIQLSKIVEYIHVHTRTYLALLNDIYTIRLT